MSINFIHVQGRVIAVQVTDDELLHLRGLANAAEQIMDRVVKEGLQSHIYAEELTGDLYELISQAADTIEISGRHTISGNPVVVSLASATKPEAA